MSSPSFVLAAMLGSTELLLILAVLLLLFGGAKLPSLARGLGQSVKEFKKATKDDEAEKPAAEVKKAEPASGATTTPTGTK